MISWRDNLRAASFREAQFSIDSHEYEFGRKNIFHDFPFRDDAELEDQGAEIDVFNITGYVLQNKSNNFDYFKARDKLIKALKDPGTGLLVHRYLGGKNVALQGRARMTETFSEGGIARFQMTFKEILDKPVILPALIKKAKFKPAQATFEPISAMDIIAEDSSARILDEVGVALGGEGGGDIAPFVLEAAGNTLGDLAKVGADINSGMQNILSKIRELKSLPGSVISTALALVTTATALIDEVLSTPCDLVNAIGGAFDSFLFAAGMLEKSVRRDILGACSGRLQNADEADVDPDVLSQSQGTALATAAIGLLTFGSDLPQIRVVSPASAVDKSNQQSTINLIRGQAAVTACRIAVRTQFTSQDDAQALLLLMIAKMDAFLNALGLEAGDSVLSDQGVVFNNDETYQSMKQLQAGLKKSMDAIGASLAKIVQFDVGTGVLSTLTLAYDRYEDLGREQEINDRNPLLIINPSFIPNGKTINILSE